MLALNPAPNAGRAKANTAAATTDAAALAAMRPDTFMSNMTNQAAVKRRALEVTQQRAWKPTRVAKSFLDRIEAQTRAAIVREVQAHPSKGKTLT